MMDDDLTRMLEFIKWDTRYTYVTVPNGAFTHRKELELGDRVYYAEDDVIAYVISLDGYRNGFSHAYGTVTKKGEYWSLGKFETHRDVANCQWQVRYPY